jgi:hypothetical protein
VLDKVRHDPPRPPREVVGDTPRALGAVCLKALAKKREERYPSAKALAAEAQRWLADEPVTAYRDPPTVLARRWARRHRAAVAATVAILATAVASLSVAAGLLAAANQRERQAKIEALLREEDARKNWELAEAEGLRANSASALAQEEVRRRLAETEKRLQAEQEKSERLRAGREAVQELFACARLARNRDYDRALFALNRARQLVERSRKTSQPDEDVDALSFLIDGVQRQLRYEREQLSLGFDPAPANPANALKRFLDIPKAALLIKEEQPARAVAAADLLADNARGSVEIYFAACSYALCAPLADRPETKEKYAARAVELLRQAVAKGYKDAAQMGKDADLDALRQRDDFKKLLADLEAASKPKPKDGP